jgi:SAM-dependent methyltransferase
VSVAPDERTTKPAATFGSGGREPYAKAIAATGAGILFLQKFDGPTKTKTAQIDTTRWNGEASAADLQLLRRVRGPVLDIGCGPGRMVRAATALGMDALGIDVSAAAVEIAHRHGVNALKLSVFDEIPLEGKWNTVLLVDENIGIGGNVTTLLRRCAHLIAADGEILVEVSPDARRDRAYRGRLVDGDGNHSETFPWAEVGIIGLANRAIGIGLALRQSWTSDDRTFARLAKRR